MVTQRNIGVIRGVYLHPEPSSQQGQKWQKSISGFSDTVFSKLVFAGKIKSAIKYISENSSAGFLCLDDKPVPGSAKTVRDILLEKHPPPQTPPPHALMKEEPLCVNPIMFERLTPDLIKDVGRHTSGSAGPSVL